MSERAIYSSGRPRFAKIRQTDLLRRPFASGLFLSRTPGPLWSSAP
jgi:hypothetical protein